MNPKESHNRSHHPNSSCQHPNQLKIFCCEIMCSSCMVTLKHPDQTTILCSETSDPVPIALVFSIKLESSY
jgi:hypothetical protein